MLDPLLEHLSAGAYWPALAALLLLATYAVRKIGADARLTQWLRPWIPIGLSAGAFLIAWLTGAAGVAEAAAQSLAAAVTAIAGHDTGQALLALARSLLGKPPAGELVDEVEVHRHGNADSVDRGLRRVQRSVRARAMISGPMSVIIHMTIISATALPGCAAPQGRPMSALARAPEASLAVAAAETRAECRRLQSRSWLTGAGSAGAGALAAGLGATALPLDGDRVRLGLGVASAVTAAVGAGLALLSTRYGSAVEEHCSPWPAADVPLPFDEPRALPEAEPAKLRQVAGPVFVPARGAAW